MLWAPQPGPQAEAISADWCPELFYGGAAGGGKSDFLLGDFLQDVPTYGSAWRGALFRRTYGELRELQSRADEIFPATGATYTVQDRTWRWPNGAFLELNYLEADRDALRYQGRQFTWIGFDELTQWATLYPWRYLRGRLRSAHNVPTKRMRGAGNPGGPGHLEVKAYFIDPQPTGFQPILDAATGLERMFVPAKLGDNAVLARSDPTYAARLRGLGGNLARAMLDGDWNIIEGAFFDTWSDRNVVRPFEIPAGWTRFRSFDWGSARPFSVGWWAVAGDAMVAGDRHVPRGALVRYREWYGSTGKPNEGLKLTAETVAQGILHRDNGDKIAYAVADPAIFSSDGGPSIGERMFTEGLRWRRADNARVARSGAMGGWDQMRARITGDDDGPGLVVFSTCRDFIRTVPVLQHDKDRPEDLDTDGEDHIGDETRYACMSRPYIKRVVVTKTEPPRGINQMTWNEAMQQQDARKDRI
jgi:hypothetical protein